MTLARRAAGDTPIIGDTRISFVGARQRRILERVERVLVTSAPPFE